MILKEARPMKAATMRPDDEAWSSDRWIFEPKLDGLRQLCYIDGKGIRFKSPKISEQTNAFVDNTARVPHFVKALRKVPKGTVLDGEITSPSALGMSNSNYVMTLLKPLPKKSLERQKENGWLEFHIFDVLWFKGKDLRKCSLEYRKKKLKSLFKTYLDSQYIFQVPIVTATFEKGKETTHEQKFKLLNTVLDKGGEGVVAKCLDSEYITRDPKSHKSEYRSPWWRKLKKESTYDRVIVGFTQPDKTSVKTDGEVSPNRFYAKRWISGIVIAQYTPRKKFDRKATLDLLKGYRKAHATYEAVINFCSTHVIKIKGVSYTPQPLGVVTGMPDHTRRLMSEKPEDYIGTTLEIRANERFVKTKRFRHPRFAKFRLDKPAELCVYRADES